MLYTAKFPVVTSGEIRVIKFMFCVSQLVMLLLSLLALPIGYAYTSAYGPEWIRPTSYFSPLAVTVTIIGLGLLLLLAGTFFATIAAYLTWVGENGLKALSRRLELRNAELSNLEAKIAVRRKQLEALN